MLTGRRPRSLIVAAGLVVAVATAGCGGDQAAGGGTDAGGGQLVVSAATSLTNAFTAYGKTFDAATARFSFAGSDMLAAQIRQGVRPDVFASANTKLPDQLFADGLVQRPTVFAANRLVLAVPENTTKVSALTDLTKPGVTIAAGSVSVPVGSYTRKVLAKLGTAQSKAVLANVRTSEPNVGGIVGKLTQGAVDAGFVYITDVTATNGELKAIALAARLQPRVAYGVAIVKGAKHVKAARAFIAGLRSGAGRRALAAAGFEPPPS